MYSPEQSMYHDNCYNTAVAQLHWILNKQNTVQASSPFQPKSFSIFNGLKWGFCEILILSALHMRHGDKDEWIQLSPERFNFCHTLVTLDRRENSSRLLVPKQPWRTQQQHVSSMTTMWFSHRPHHLPVLHYLLYPSLPSTCFLPITLVSSLSHTPSCYPSLAPLRATFPPSRN